MSGRRSNEESQVHEAGLEELLREVGSRSTPPSEVTREVYEGVRAEWRDVVAGRKRRRRTWLLASAASVILALGVALFMTPRFEQTPTALASVVRVVGEATRSSSAVRMGAAFAVGDTMYAGDEMLTAETGGVSLDLGRGLSVRVDRDSRVRFVEPGRIELLRGALYVDANPGTGATADLVVDTHIGSVRHHGTQYEVRDLGDALRISVREGRVAFTDRGVTHGGAAGEQLFVRPDGSVAREPTPPGDARWDWAVRIAPPFEIANQPLSVFLAWAARETGCSIEFASQKAQQAAETTILRGSIADLDPEAALDAVLATTDLHIAHRDARQIQLSLE
ncbi:MAG: FecR family protein [Steroidobacteraceae bacterium]|jgi:ferric-dicitrate binding protein FerR (iron transport regulator)|nr:FecR family protein [Steroidobacteraceae bacterium]